MRAEAAEGFTFLGFMPDGDDTAYVTYGLVLVSGGVYGAPLKFFQPATADVHAVFYPTDQLTQRVSSGG
ncbi:MAG TPA: hypothetical protein VFX11_07830, partial [Candidatus Kapabacteria bacterium]|nr:hypothetical protein [Candidatus Kapabacteria bacterium]